MSELSELVTGIALVAVTSFIAWGSWITKASITLKVEQAKLKQELCDHIK